MDDELREFLNERFEAIDRRFAGMDQRFADIDRRFATVDQPFAELRHELTVRIDGVRNDVGVIVEGQREQIRLSAEGHSVLVARVDRLEQTLTQAIESMGREILAAVKFSYAELDRRLTRLEALTVDLESRVRRLEADR